MFGRLNVTANIIERMFDDSLQMMHNDTFLFGAKRLYLFLK